MEWAAQEGGGGNILEVFKTGSGSQCHGLVEKVVFSPRSDFMISKFFSKLVDSVIL